MENRAEINARDTAGGNQERMLAANIAEVRRHIHEAAERVGRSVDDITLVAVSKTKPLDFVRMAYNLGVSDFGENRVQEAVEKMDEFHPEDLRWHMIGHVQTNKVNKVMGMFDCIHSVDSLHLAQALNRYAEQESQHRGKEIKQPVLLQVNISGEATKEGMSPDETIGIARQIVALPHLDVEGLMTVAPLVDNVEETRPVFRALRVLRDRLRYEVPESTWRHLSMGMTDDYRVAIEEDATIVRVGRAIFGERERK